MFRFLRILWKGLFQTRKRGYTLRGFWGERKHYNKDGVQIGYSVKGFWGGWKRYDMEGNLISYTLRNFWGGYDTYDADGNLIRKSRRNFGGGFNTYDTSGKKVTETYRSFWGGVNHYEVDEPECVASPTVEVTAKLNQTSGNNTPSPKPQTVEPSQTKKVTPTQTTTPPQTKIVTPAQTTTLPQTKIVTPTQTTTPPQTKIVTPAQTTTPTRTERATSPSTPELAWDKEDSYIHRDSQEYNELLRNIDDTGAKKFEFKEMSTEGNPVNILAFSYETLKEFPAQAIFAEETVWVEPLIMGVSSFTFSMEEITQAVRRVVENLDEMTSENEFSSLNSSALLIEFDDLLPEYEYGINGMSRVQYEFRCGLTITENSWLKLCAKMGQ